MSHTDLNPPGWEARIEQLRSDLARVDPDAQLQQITWSGVGPKALWVNVSPEGEELIWEALDELSGLVERHAQRRPLRASTWEEV